MGTCVLFLVENPRSPCSCRPRIQGEEEESASGLQVESGVHPEAEDRCLGCWVPERALASMTLRVLLAVRRPQSLPASLMRAQLARTQPGKSHWLSNGSFSLSRGGVLDTWGHLPRPRAG